MNGTEPRRDVPAAALHFQLLFHGRRILRGRREVVRAERHGGQARLVEEVQLGLGEVHPAKAGGHGEGVGGRDLVQAAQLQRRNQPRGRLSAIKRRLVFILILVFVLILILALILILILILILFLILMIILIDDCYVYLLSSC